MKLLFVMDPLPAIDVGGDTTLAFMVEAHRRTHAVWHCEPRDLALEHERAIARARPATVRIIPGDHYTLGEPSIVPLEDCDAVFIRKDPPFDATYFMATLLCEQARGKTLFVNDPRALREANEKLLVLRFPELTPPTIVTSDRARIRAFAAEQHHSIVVKPLDGRGGEGVFVLRSGDQNANAILEVVTDFGKRWALAQRYLPEVREGDKRILLLGGQPLGAVLRVPREDDARANLHVGGRAERTSLTPRDREICARIGPTLALMGLHFVGIDVIGPWLTEINVTSPTGLREIDALEGVTLERDVIDWVERAAAAAKG
ncbi:MAG: glutathione synthase [Myxococcota bacterium]